MEAQALHAALTATLSPNQTERQAAETVLKSVDAAPGYLPCLFQIINSSEVAPQVKQAGIIYFKNLVVKHWQREHDDGGGHVVFSEGDKHAIRIGLIDALLVSTNLTRPPILLSLRTIAQNDFPHKMPGFVEQLSTNLDPALQHPDRAMASLRALRALCKVYEYRALDRRQGPISSILEATFPQLASILEIVLAGDPADEVGAEVLKIGIKTLWSVSHQSLPVFLQNEQTFMRWMQILYRTLELPAPPGLAAGTHEDLEELSQKPLWKAKRWTAQVLQRLMSKYGNLKQAAAQFANEDKAGELAISHVFHNQLAVRFLNLLLQVLSTKSQGAFLPERLVVEACSYIMCSVTLAITWQELKQNVMPLITHVIFPVLCFERRDRDMWNNDPLEFVRLIYDVMEDYTSQRVQSARLLIDLCQKRPKTCLMPILNFCHEVLVGCSAELQQHQQEAAAGTETAEQRAALESAASRKDGGMYLLGSLHTQLRDPLVYTETGAKVEWLMENCIATDLQSSIHHLRARACWAMGHLAILVDKNSEFFIKVVRCVVAMLRDPQLPVRFQACVALRWLIHDASTRGPTVTVQAVIGEQLPQIMEQLFTLMDQVGSDELVQTLDVLIESFASKMPPYAQNLCHRLSETFVRLATSDDPDTDSSLAASQCCTAICTLLDALRETDSPQLFTSIETALVPLLHLCLSKDPSGDYPYTEFIEDVLEVMTRLTYYSPEISELLWTLYQPLATCLTEWALDYVSEFQMSFMNYISRASAAFVSVPQRPETMFRVCQRVLEHSNSLDSDVVDICLLAQTMLLHCQAAVEPYITGFVSIVIHRLQRYPPTKENERSELIKVIAACLVVNAPMTLSAAEQQSATQVIFQLWLQSIVVLGEKDTPRGKETIRTHFRNLNDKKLCILGITSILRTPTDQLLSSIKEAIGHLLAALITLFFDMDVIRRRRLAAAQSDAPGPKELVPSIIAVDVKDDEDYDPRSKLASFDGVLAQLQDDGDFDEDDEDEEDDDSSPIDAIDEVLFFAEAWNGIKTASTDEAAQENILKTLDAGQRAFMDSILASVPQRIALRQAQLTGAAAALASAGS
mmetsp:Transcript_103123/g.166244  ORF Transcript_103123/g.166244 Transcript_103123/m.166244 type:complete len:1085 (+) Transcript_103123:63-3317(+)